MDVHIPLPKLVRQTNEWIFYRGKYPEACATTNAPVLPSRHVLKVEADDEQIAKHVEFIYEQLDVFADAGLLTFIKRPGMAIIHDTALYDTTLYDTTLTFYTSEGMFHVFASNPDLKSLNHIIYCLRSIFTTPGLFTTLVFEIDYEKWVHVAPISWEPVHQYFRPRLEYPCDWGLSDWV